MNSRRWISYLIAFVVTSPVGLVSYYFTLYLKTPKPAPIQVLPSATWWVGRVYPGQMASKTFLLRNISDRAQRILFVEKGCCTDIQIDKMQIPPHQMVQAQVTVKTAGRLGYFRLFPLMGFQGYRLPMRLDISGEITQPLPTEVDFGRFPPNTSKLLLIQLLSNNQPHLRVLKAQYRPKFFHIVSIQPAAAGLLITLRTQSHLPVGPFQQRIFFLTNDPVQPHMETLVKGEVLPMLLVSPNPVSLGVFQKLSTQHTCIALETSTRAQFRIAQVCAQPKELFRIVRCSRERFWKQTLELEYLGSSTLPEGPFCAQLCIFTEPPLPYNPIVVPIYGYCRTSGLREGHT